MTNAERKLRAVVRVLNQVPGFLDQVYESAEAVERIREQGRALYEKTHWGHKGRHRDQMGEVPNVASGVVELGALYRIDYLAKKGKHGAVDQYFHHFSYPLPILGFAFDGSGLVIVRGRSRYKVTRHGIEG